MQLCLGPKWPQNENKCKLCISHSKSLFGITEQFRKMDFVVSTGGYFGFISDNVSHFMFNSHLSQVVFVIQELENFPFDHLLVMKLFQTKT